jgi:predicted DNA-binding protein
MAERDELNETLSIRISTKERQRLTELADRDDRRISQFVRQIVRRALASDDGNGVAA